MFVPVEYWTIQGIFNENIEVKLDAIDGRAVGTIKFEEDADEILNDLPNLFVVNDVTTRNRRIESKAPFTTSTLQQEAFIKHKYSTFSLNL